MAFLFLSGAIYWVGTEYAWLGGKSTDSDARTSACMKFSGSVEVDCPTDFAAIMSNIKDSAQSTSQGTYSVDAASNMQSPASQQVRRPELPSDDMRLDIEDSASPAATGFTELGDRKTANYGNPQYIGGLINPDAEDFGSLANNDVPVSLGEYVDPEGDLPYDSDDAEQAIGAFINPDVVEVIGDTVTEDIEQVRNIKQLTTP